MKNTKSFLSSLLLVCLLVLVPVTYGECYSEIEKDVPISIGSIKLPKDAYVTEYDLYTFWQVYNGVFFKTNVDNERVQRDIEEISKFVSFYQVVLKDGKQYRIAYLFVVKNDIPKSIYAEYLDKPISKEYQKEMLENYEYSRQWFNRSVEQINGNKVIDVSRVNKITPENISLDGYIHNLELGDVKFIKINGKQAYSAHVRLAGEVSTLFFTAYGKTYTFGSPNFTGEHKRAYDQAQMNVIAFITIDNEAVFWTRVFDKYLAKGVQVK